MEESVGKNEVIIGECPVLNVVVYKDRAEVTREISLELEAGAQEVRETACSSLDRAFCPLVVTGHGVFLCNDINFYLSS